MSAKSKSDDNTDNQGYQSTSQDPELEKKVDAMLSEERPVSGESDKSKSEKKANKKSETKAEEPGASGAPLLPSDKLPDLDKKTKKTKKATDASAQQQADAASPDASSASAEAAEAAAEPPLTEAVPASEPEEPSGFVSPREEIPSDVPTTPAATAAQEPTEAPSSAVAPESAKAPEPEELPDDLGLEDVGTGKAVDEIVSAEADELIAARDKDRVQAEVSAKPREKRSFRKFLAAWWHNKLARNATFALIFLALAAALAFPNSRYFILNNSGVRSSASITVLDQTTGQPLKNAEFRLAGQSGKTDGEGNVRLHNLRLGRTTLMVSKPAFAEISQPVTVGWGSNPLGDFRLKAVGSQYTFVVTDFASRQPIAKAEASSGEANARSNEKGEIVLTVPQTEKDRIDVIITSDNYRTENMAVPIVQKEVMNLALVPARKHVFISKRSGTYDVYKIDVDGKNEERILGGTGREQLNTLALSPHPTKNVAALVSSRDEVRNGDGFRLNTLTIIDLSDNETSKVTQSERIQLVDWIGDKLVYVKITEGASAASKDRHKLISYDLNTGKETELATTNYFNDVLAANGSIYYSPASFNVNGSVGLFKINAEGNNRKMIYDKEIWNLFRTAYDKLSVSMGQDWFELNLDNDALSKSSAPAAQKSRVYFDNPQGGNTSLWTDDRDGKGTLLSYDNESREDKVLHARSGLKNPVRWLSGKHIIFRVNNAQESADYLINADGGDPIKIRDVTDTAGIDRWYYY